jgi:GAF domain-containing protein
MHMATPPLVSPATDLPSFRERTLARLVDHVRTLIPVDAITFATRDERRAAVEPAAGWFSRPELRDSFREVVGAVTGRDRPLFLPRLDAWEAGPGVAGRGTALGAASVIACPLRTEVGHVIGHLVVASLDPARPLRRRDLRTMAVVADLAAMALERAGLLEDEARRGREELLLKRAAEAVSASLELDEVYRRVVEHATEVTGARRGLLSRLNARSGELRPVAAFDADPAASGERLQVEADRIAQVARARRPQLQVADGVALMHAPIELGPRLYGVLTVAHDRTGGFRDEQLDLLARLARSSAAAIANAIDFGRERRIARALTLGFVPESLPGLPGYDTGLLYAPALGEPTGGDVYGAWLRPDGDVAVLVGDVAGKGVENAALSAMVRFFVEARSWDARSPAEVLEQTNSMLMERLPPDTFVTAFYGVLSPTSLRWAGAGHLPPLHVSGPHVRALDPHGLPLGVDAAPGYGESELELAAGDLIFAFTDGLIEARRGDETYGISRLSRSVATLAQALGPEDLVVAVHDDIADWSGGLGDDAVALALRRRR